MNHGQIQKVTHIFFSRSISVYAIFNDQSFNDTLTNDIVNFEELGPGRVANNVDPNQMPCSDPKLRIDTLLFCFFNGYWINPKY